MPIHMLTSELRFPPPEGASAEGIVAVGGDFRPERLLLAYAQGIFPWPSEGLPLLWFSPDPRFALRPSAAHVPRSLRKTLRKGRYTIRLDRAFSEVISNCSAVFRPGQRGTWITRELVAGYEALHARGYAHSAEAWLGDELVGGLYGVALGNVFFGESMFSLEPDASKCAFTFLLAQLTAWGFTLVDCQVHTEHLERFGAVEWPRPVFLAALRDALEAETRLGPWKLEIGLPDVLAWLEKCRE